MTETEVLDVMYQMFQTVLKLALPLLLVSMIIGIIVAIFQAATQINEQTMTFVPKLLAVIAILGLLGSSMLKTLQDFLQMVIAMIAGG
ncbi:MAG: flagellar type III secretion system protein FliQ [Lachnospiraceae bacterium]|nr:flagellar type III secretion system protein FliQ [Lachnospiraceae bacterium]